MDITPYVEGLRRDLVAAAEASGPEVKAAVERLAFALDPSARLALMEAISQAAAEITTELPTGSVDVRLNGRELAFGVHLPTPAPAEAPSAEAEAEDADEGSLVRITLRLPESVKARAEELATKAGTSLNTWLVNVVRAATRENAINIDLDLSSLNATINSALDDFGDLGGFGGRGGRGPGGFGGPGGRGGRGRRMNGWI